MSRFVLRSKEGTKLQEQKDKLKSTSNVLRTPSKKVDNRKSRNSNSLKDSVQQDLCPKHIVTDGDEEEKNSPVSIICSLPLSRLTGIIDKLSLKSTSKCINKINSIENVFTKPGKTTNGALSIEDDDNKEKEQDEKQSLMDDDTSNSKSQDQNVVKILCLYCDKKFNTVKMQEKHIEKFHTPQKDRRCSVRNSQVQTIPRNKSAARHADRITAALSSTNFPGCLYCKKTKLLETIDPVVDFNGLFLHLTEYHADRYFGCKICVIRFQNIAKLLKHMQNVHNSLPDAQLKLTKDYNESPDEVNIEPSSPVDRHTRAKQRNLGQLESTSTTVSVLDQSKVIGAEEAILSRLGLTQNRRRNPSNRKGIRNRRDTNVPDILLKSDTITPLTSTSTSSLSPSKSRSRTAAKSTNSTTDSDSIVFRVPTRTDPQSTTFDESFYKEVTSNVRNNLLFHIDGKLGDRSHTWDKETEDNQDKTLPLLLRSTLASNIAIPEILENNPQDSEIHVATNLPAITAFPTLLTAEQYCVDVTAAKIRRPHTKHSWKWKWDSVKKYKLINEGGKIVKKAKHPMLGLRDLSKLDMWTQLSMRQKHEKQLSLLQDRTNGDECCSVEKRRLNDQLNSILDMRVLPHIILEQSEQAIIKLENEEFNLPSTYERRDDSDDFYSGNIVGQTFADEGFLSLLQLLPRREVRPADQRLVLSGEWARPRCYLCMCCGNKFEKLKSLEEHKMFRHSNILSTHYEVVGRELLAGNILQHLFIPKRALNYYSNAVFKENAGNTKALVSYRRIHTSAEEESSDSIQSISNCYATQRTYRLKHTNSTTDECDTDTKTSLLGDMNTISPSHSLQSTFSSSLTPSSSSSQTLQKETNDIQRKRKCSKCSRKCNRLSDLHRHMLDCSGDYVWSMAKKRKYRYYCGSKKRRPLHKQHMLESRKTKQEKPMKNQSLEHSTTEESSSNSFKPKTPPRPRPSDAESIKKMLENLPPKRICKKIFPTINKTRKTRKSSFITKLYNTKVLRKTRARQISNAAKRAASTRFSGKAQVKKNALKTLRCNARKRIVLPKESNPQSNVENINCKLEKRGSPKKDLSNEETNKDPKKDETPNEMVAGVEKESDNLQPVPEEQNKNPSSSRRTSQNDAKNFQDPLELQSDMKSNTGENMSETVTETTNRLTESTQEISKPQPTENQAFNKKRSKRISDCIAMLTGKLEEKLKTESTVNSKNPTTVETVETNSKISPLEKEKKTPKRKAISRRIIKPDVNDTTSSELEQQVKAVIPTTVPPIVTTTVTTAKKVMTTKETVTTTSITTTIVSVKPPVITTTPATAKPKTVPPLAAQLPVPPPTVAVPMKGPINNMPIAVSSNNSSAKLVLPNAMTSQTLVPIPIPMAPSLHAVPVPLKVLQNHIPVYLPVQQNIATATLPPPAPLPLSLPPNTNTAPGVIPTVTLLPPPPLLQTHISPVLATSTSPLCSMEPLNLSSAKGPKKQTTAELRAQRPGMPARRQTICGFEARDFITYNEMEPLDLSKKSKDPSVHVQTLPPAQPQPPPVQVSLLNVKPTMSSVELLTPVKPAQVMAQAVPLATRIHLDEPTTKPNNLTIPPTLPLESVFSKQFYSNLDLLKIPQVRATGFIPINLPTSETMNNPNNGIISNVCSNTNLPVALKTNNTKKRNNSKSGNEQIPNKQPPAVAIVTPNKTRDHIPPNKKESVAKHKPTTKMDEEVINHIDDAINSVINAVKASFPENDEDEVPPNKFAKSKSPEPKLKSQEKTIDNVEKPLEEPTVNKENSTPVAPEIILTPKKRTLRSKTLDCRSELMRISQPVSRAELLSSPISRQINTPLTDHAACKESPQVPAPQSIMPKIVIEKQEDAQPQSVSNSILKEETTPSPIDKNPLTTTTTDHNIPEKPINIKVTDSEIETVPSDKTVIEKESIKEPSLQESNVNLIAEENMSNINNTSSGFHSSGTPENGTDVKKKQRRRRKNELAAIVADQLLESFKIDKARRDSLKKLENLAYEKSEDLLLTGMLLMSSTKRNASSGLSFTQNSTEKRSENLRRQKQVISTSVSAPKTRGKSTENSTKNSDPKSKIEEEFSENGTRKSKRRQSRRKTAPLDNENLTKLKSSLESFSIGIEKQLSEFEARNTNIYNNNDSKSRKNLEQPTQKPTSSIIRPSILSAKLEQADTQKTSLADNSKTTFSRDPRLNKNIHKDEQPSALAPNGQNILPVCDLEDDNYLTEIAKNVNEKIMSAANEDFAFADDGFEIGNEYQDDSNSKFSRPPTSMSVRSAPNFNDDRSNFGSICDENTNTEVMDMDLDDELSVYTSFSQDLGRGRGRKRRRRRSILLKRRPKKRRASQDMAAEKFECELCKKTFFAATSLSKHNMTLAHVSKLSEREYLLSKSARSTPVEEKTRSSPRSKTCQKSSENTGVTPEENSNLPSTVAVENPAIDTVKEIVNVDTSYRLSLNPDERLFFECCNILKSADTSRIVRGDNDNENQNSFVLQNMYKNQTSTNVNSTRASASLNECNQNVQQKTLFDEKADPKAGQVAKTQDTFRNPVAIPNCFNRLSSTIASTPFERQTHSPTYTQFSAVTNTTSRFKTKAAMKGYENGNVHITLPDETKSRATCKLTELADIALGHDDKPTTPEIAPNLDPAIIGSAKGVVTPEYVTLSVVDSRRNCNYNAAQDNKKATETQGSSSSRTIMHSSIIKAAVEEHVKPQPTNKIIIPERPFKNIGLEEKESITFQKPKTTVNLLFDDNSVSTASYSDRDDFDFGSMSCDDEVSDKTLNEKNVKSNSSESSSSRATAKTFENKSLIMGRIFKNASTKPKAPVKSVGVQKDQTPKADLDQLFDELRAEGVPKAKTLEIPAHMGTTPIPQEEVCQNVQTGPTVIPTPEPKRKSKPIPKKPKANKKPQKDLTKLQSELGMSQEEIEKLIDDGQRKSKRRCAANRSKKMVEMWSSDEYEEFLSTKDIIALIEEKEKQEKRKKRKTTANATNVEVGKDKEMPTGAASRTVMNDVALSPTKKSSKTQLNNQEKGGENEKIATAPAPSKPMAKEKEKGKPKPLNAEDPQKSNTWLKPSEDSTNTSKASKSRKVKNTRQTSNKSHKDVKVPEKTVLDKTEAPTEALDPQSSEPNLYLFDMKPNNNNTPRSNRTKKDVNSFKSQNRDALTGVADLKTDMKKRNSTSNKNNNNNNNKKNKGKRKPQTEKSPTRKRQASEKLYYWSSSSDEDFGRINDNEPEYESSEPYQKHGWIVGDSHKKLVTLLAIAKGNKKVESCGVKKNVSKRKN